MLLFNKENKEYFDLSSSVEAQRSLLQTIINLLCIRPYKVSQRNMETKLFMSDVQESFKKQTLNRVCQSQEEIQRNVIEAKYKEPSESSSLGGGKPMGFGVMEIDFDRSWNEAQFCGKVYGYGVMFSEQAEVISKHLISIFKGNADKQKYLQELSGCSLSGALSLSAVTPLSNFSFSSEVSGISSGYNTIAFVSSLGKVLIQAPTMEFACCLGVEESPQNWNGILYLDGILGRRIKSISCGSLHFAAITETNEVILWGCNINPSDNQISGQLGNRKHSVSPPVIIVGLYGNPLAVCCGKSHTVLYRTKTYV